MTETANDTILCVDDDAGTLLLYRRSCEHLGFRVETAANGLEAQKRLLVKRYRAVISDFMMGAMDGLELLEWMRRSGYATQFILATSFYNPSFDSLYTRFSNLEIVAKPLTLIRLKEAIGSIAAKESPALSSADRSSVPVPSAPMMPERPVAPPAAYPQGEELAQQLSRRVPGAAAVRVLDLDTGAVLGGVTLAPDVNGEVLDVALARLAGAVSRRWSGNESDATQPSSLLMMGGTMVYYLFRVQGRVAGLVALHRADLQIGFMKLAIAKVLQSFTP